MNRKSIPFSFIFTAFICSSQSTEHASAQASKDIVNKTGITIQTRFNPPPGFERKPISQHSFAHYLRNLPLKPSGSKVKYYNGAIKSDRVYAAVVDFNIGNKNLQQCADAVMRLRAEYFFATKAFQKISFTLTNNFRMDYSEWMKGNRLVVNGNTTFWRKTTRPSNTYKDFSKYMDDVYTYAGTISLSKSLQAKSIHDLNIGDVFIRGGSPGHAVLVADVAEKPSGERVFLLVQSYMPAQETQVLRNLQNSIISPWYSATIFGKLITPEWTFYPDQLKTW